MRSFSQRVLVMLAFDALLVNAACYGTLLLRFDGQIPSANLQALVRLIPLITGVSIGFFVIFKLYSRIWKYASLDELVAIIKATTCSVIVIAIYIMAFKLPPLPGSVYIVAWGLIIFGIGASRLWWRLFREIFPGRKRRGIRALIVGAGDAGALLAREIQSQTYLGLELVAFVDDDPKKLGKIMMGVPVKGNHHDIPELVASLEIEKIFIAIPSLRGPVMREIINICEGTPAKVRILPELYQSSLGNLMSQVRKLKMEDLLGREPVQVNMLEICGYIHAKTVLVTGGGGSIGSELCRQILGFKPQLLVILDNCENNLFDIEMELIDAGYGKSIAVVLEDVKHGYNVEEVFQKYHPQLVFHAAAYKHVPMVERYPEEALWNNVVGSLNAAEMADKYRSEAFILISSDKAVNPTSIMGATKRLAELVVKDFNWSSQTRFAAVRFGNVLGSRGSVIPTFEKQIERGGPVTVTHPDMKRFFMTIPEAVGLVIQAGAMARGGEIFVLDMGEPIKIVDLAYDLIRLYGYKPGQDIEVIFTGMRPGEKLFEELFYNREEIVSTPHERIYISSKEADHNYIGIHRKIIELIKKAGSDRSAIIELISDRVPEYHQPDHAVIPVKAEKENEACIQ